MGEATENVTLRPVFFFPPGFPGDEGAVLVAVFVEVLVRFMVVESEGPFTRIQYSI